MSLVHKTKLWTAIVTPFHEDGAIDYTSFEKLLHRQAEAQNGVVLLGSTGESLNLDEKERKEIVQWATGLKLNIPLKVGVGGIHLAQTKAWVEYLNQQNVDSYLIVAPLYAKPGPCGQKEWFEALLRTATRPCMLYNVPSRTGVKLDPTALQALTTHGNFYALKEASGSVEEYGRFAKALPNIKMYSGDDEFLAPFASLRADGLVSVMSNIWPRQTARYTEKCLAGETAELFPLWQEAAQSMFVCSNPVAPKVYLKDLGIIQSDFVRAPLSRNDFPTEARERFSSIHRNIERF